MDINDESKVIRPKRRTVTQLALAMGGQSGARTLFALCSDGKVFQCIATAKDDKNALVTAQWYLVDTRDLETVEIQ